MQNGKQGQFGLVSRVGVPVGRALDAEPIDVAVLIDIAEVRDFGMIGMAVIDERVRTRLAKASSEACQISGPEVLIAEYEHRVLGERPSTASKVSSCSGFDRSTLSTSVPSACPSGRSSRSPIMRVDSDGGASTLQALESISNGYAAAERSPEIAGSACRSPPSMIIEGLR
jgi:hypothetical protein